MNKEKVIELLHKYGNESEMFKAFVTEDEFENLAEDLVKLFAIPVVSGCFIDKFEDKLRECYTRHDYLELNKWILNNR